MSEDQVRLPIKVVIPQEGDLHQKRGRRAKREPFVQVDTKYRTELCDQLSTVRDYFAETLKGGLLPCVARVTLRREAIAKSHRPHALLSHDTCPIIGCEDFGQLLISVRDSGLERLGNWIDSGKSHDIVVDISTVLSIEPYTAEDAMPSVAQIQSKRGVSEANPWFLKLRLFRHRIPKLDAQILAGLQEISSRLKLELPTQLKYAESLDLYKVGVTSSKQLRALAAFVGTQSVGPIPRYRLVTQYVPHGQADDSSFPLPDSQRQYPTVGVIDSGTDPRNERLQAWVLNRDEDDVPAADQDNRHGTFVAGLAANAHSLNHRDPRFPNVSSKIVDVVAVPQDATPLYENVLLDSIRRVVAKFQDVKVWNLSLSLEGDGCCDDKFSHFAIALDDIQARHDVTFVVCVGNYRALPRRGWPAQDLGQADRVLPPADSVRSIAVGSVAHAEHSQTLVHEGEPSPFTRKGPGASYLPKPDVAHYGGNCDSSFAYAQVGILSLNGDDGIAEGVGTSFSTPIVAALLANLRAGVAEPISRNLARALLVHSAALNSPRPTPEDLRYRGFGIPSDVPSILTCAPWQATLIFEPDIAPERKLWLRRGFPIPDCFRTTDGGVRGEIVMTLVYDPPVNPHAGAEYCQVNVDVSLGTQEVIKGEVRHVKRIPPEPAGAMMFEDHLVKYGFKWSPVKVFRKKMQRTSGVNWEIEMPLLCRDSFELQTPLSVALVVTLLDPEHRLPVYNDVVRAMSTAGWVTQDLRVSPRVQVRTGAQ